MPYADSDLHRAVSEPSASNLTTLCPFESIRNTALSVNAFFCVPTTYEVGVATVGTGCGGVEMAGSPMLQPVAQTVPTERPNNLEKSRRSIPVSVIDSDARGKQS